VFVVVLGVAIAAVCVGCGSTSSAATHLVVARETSSGATVLLPSQATLTCDGTAHATGFLRKAAGPACALVDRHVVQQVAANQRSRRLCSQIYGGPQSAHITGTVGGQDVNLTITRTDGCGTADWQTLAPLLGDPHQQGFPNAAAAPSTAATTTTAPPVNYLVKRGDTITSIARQFHVPIAVIVAANHLADPNHLVEGQSLVIPPFPPVQLAITPPEAQVGATFELKLTGAQPSETVTFEIDTPDNKYTGPPHAASADGVVTTTYQSAVGNTPGVYNVVAKGNQGTTAQASFRVDTASTP
jgi:LysM repeat protein